jgi:hypothetical protein
MLIKWVEVRLVSPRGCSRSLTQLQWTRDILAISRLMRLALSSRENWGSCCCSIGRVLSHVKWGGHLFPQYTANLAKWKGEKGPFGEFAQKKMDCRLLRLGTQFSNFSKSLPDIHGKTAEYSHFILYFCKLIRYNK